MEDEERQKKLEAGKAKLAEYRQRKAHADSQKKQKKKKKKRTGEDSEGDSQGRVEVDPDQPTDVDKVSGGDGSQEANKDPPTTEFTFTKTLCSGETVKHDQTYTIEPESEVSTTAEDYSSEEETEPLQQVTKGDTIQDMEDALAAKTQTVEELSRELEEIRAAFGSEGVQQLQDFEAALKQRDGIITQLTTNLQQAREEKDEIMKEFLELTEQSQKLQIQFQLLQAGETLRNTSHSSTAADLLQTRQQLIHYQQQLEEMNVEDRKHQERSIEQLEHISQLQLKLNEMEMTVRRSEESFTQKLNKKDLLIAEQEKAIANQEQQLTELRAARESFAHTLEERSLLLSQQTAIITEHERSLVLLREEHMTQQSDEHELIIAEQKKIISERDCSLTQLKDELESSEKCLQDLKNQMFAKESELQKCLDELENTKSDLESCRGEMESFKLELEKEREELEICKDELSTSRQKERMSSTEIMQLMGTVEDLQKRCHQGSLSESDAIQKMQDETVRKLELLRAELDEMYGQQIVQMKQELNLQHTEKMEQMTELHNTELEFLKAQISQSSTVSTSDMNSLNEKIKALQETLAESQAMHDKTNLELSQVSQDKLNLQVQFDELLQNLQSANEKVELVSHNLKSQEGLQDELNRLHDMIDSLKSELAAAEEAAQETEIKHESEVTNYKIKLEMLEREKDAVLDRMAESQEAELERLRTQLLFSHEEELTHLREELQRESLMNTENLLNEAAIKHQKALDELRLSYEGELCLSQQEKANVATERDELLHQVFVLKEDLKVALHSSKADELVQQLQELQVELEELRKGGEERARMENKIQTLVKKTDVLEKQTKDKEQSLENKWKEVELENKTLSESNNILKEQLESKSLKIETLSTEKNQIQQEVDLLREEIENQKTTFSFAEKNFQVNYQELKEEYMCLIDAKTHLEERTLKETLEFEVKITSLQSQIQELKNSRDIKMEERNTDGKDFVEKDPTELMEKLNVTLTEKESLTGKLSEVTEQLMFTGIKVEQLEEELTKVRKENAKVMSQNESLEKELEKEQEQMRGQDAQRKAQLQKEEQGSVDHHLQIQSLQEEIKALQSLLQAAEAERDNIQQTLDLQRLSLPPSAAAAVQSLGEGPVEGRSTSQKPTASGSNRRKKRQRLKQDSKLGTSDSREERQREDEEEAAVEEESATRAAAQEKQPQMERQVMSCSQEKPNKEDSTEYQGERDHISKQVSRHRTDGHQTEPVVCQRVEEENKTTEHGECRLQMEAQRISLSQIHAAQLELLQEETDAHMNVQGDHDEPKHFKFQNMLQAVSEECTEIILSFRQIFGEGVLDSVDDACWQLPSEERPETTESTSIILEARELYRVLQQVRERIEQEHVRLSQLQALLRADGNKMMELQMAYDELKRSSDKEISDLRVQVANFNSSSSKGSQEQTGAPSEELQRLKVEDQEKQLQLEQSHRQEMEHLRAHYQQKAIEAEERYATELFVLQQRLHEVTGSQSHYSLSTFSESCLERMDEHSQEIKDLGDGELSEGVVELPLPTRSAGLTAQLQALRKALYHKYVQEVTTLKEQHSSELRRLREEREQDRREELYEERGGKEQDLSSIIATERSGAVEQLVLEEKPHWERVEEEVAKVIVQMSVAFAQQTEMARINKHTCQASTSMQTQSSGTWMEELERERLEKDLVERNVEIRRLKELLQKTETAHKQTLKQRRHDQEEIEEEEDPAGLRMKETRAHKSSSPSSQDYGESSDKDVERNLLRKANEKLSQVLADVLKTTAAAEETMGLHMQNLCGVSGEKQQPVLAPCTSQPFRPFAAGQTAERFQGSETCTDDVSLWSTERETDDGLEVSQQMMDSLLLGAETQLENEEFLMGIGTRLQMALEKMLMAITDVTNQLEHARMTQTELMRESFRHNQEISELLQKQEELQERLTEEAQAREQLALELHRAEGLIDGYTGERAVLDEQLRQKEELQMSLEQELQVTSSRLQELEQERLQMQEERELLSRQQDAMREDAGPRELRLVEAAMVAAPEADLLEETEKLMKEKVEVQRQAEKENSDLLKQVKRLEAELEEHVIRVIELEHAQSTENGDLRQQIQALEKQLDNNKKFLDEQAVERENERDVFQQEIQKLEKQLKNPQRLQTGSEQRNQEVDGVTFKVEQLTSQLKEKADWCSELLLSSEQLQRELRERDEEIDKLESRIHELEQALLASAESLEKAEQKKQHASITETRHSSLEAQLQTEREALERKEKEICNLEEQLEQFREELENKSEEVQQLHMQLEIQSKEISSQQQYLETRDSMLQVMEQKDREIALLNEQITKLRHTETASDNKEIDERDDLIKDLESQVECLQSEHERLKRNNEEELDQLNAVIEKLQQELAIIEQKQAAEEDEDIIGEQDGGVLGATKEGYEEMKHRMELATTELTILKKEHSKLLETYLCLKESEDALMEAKKLGTLEGELKEALREKTASLVVMQAQVQALEQSAASRVQELGLRIQELEDLISEKDSELSHCHLLVEQGQSHAHDLQQRISNLEENLREKMAAALVSQATREALQLQQQQSHASNENQDMQRHGELHVEPSMQPHAHDFGDFGDFGIPQMDFSGLGQARYVSTGKVVHLTQKLRELEVGLSEMQKDQELQKQLLSSSEEEVLEYERRLTVVMDLLTQMKAIRGLHQKTSPAVEASPTDYQPAVSELLQKLQEVHNEALTTKEQLISYKESCSRLQNELQEKTVTIESLQEKLQKVSTSSNEEVNLQKELMEVRDEATATKEELNSCRESLEKLQELLQEREMTIAHLQGELFQVKSEEVADSTEFLQELQTSSDDVASIKEELCNYRWKNEKLEEELQVRESSISKLKEEQQQLIKEVDIFKEELSSYRQQNEKLQQELQGQEVSLSRHEEEHQQRTINMDTTKEEFSGYMQHNEKDELRVGQISISKLKEEHQQLKKVLDTTKEELSSYRQHNKKLQEELQVQDVFISKLREENQQLMMDVDTTKKELSGSRKQNENLQEELHVQDVSISKLREENQQLMMDVDTTKKELSGSRKQNENLQEELHVQDVSISKLREENQQLLRDVDSTKEELSNYRKQNEKVQEQLQLQELSIYKLREEQQMLVVDEDTTNKELTSYRKQNKKLQEELQVREVPFSKTSEEQQQLMMDLDTTQEELSSCRQQNHKLQGQLQDRELSNSKLKEKNQQLTMDVDTTKEQLNSERKQNEKLQEKLQDRELSISTLKEENQQLLRDVDTTKEELSSYREQNEKLQEELQVREVSISKLKEEIQMVMVKEVTTNEELPSERKQNEKLQEQLEDQELSISMLKEENQQLLMDVDTTTEQLNSERKQNEKLQEKLQDRELSISTLKEENQQLLKDVDTTKEELSSYREQNEKLREELQVQEVSISKLKEENQVVMVKEDTTNEELPSKRKQNEKLQKELQDQELSISKIKEENQQLLRDVDTTKVELRSYRKQNEKLREELQVQEVSISKLKEEIQMVMVKEDTTNEELPSERKQNEKLQEELQDQELSISMLKEENQQLLMDVDTTKEELRSYRKQNEKLQEQLQVREVSISKLKEEIQQLMMDVDTTKDQLSSYRQQNEQLQEELQVREVSIAKFREDNQMVMIKENTINEELPSERKQNEKLQEELQDRELVISSLNEDNQQLVKDVDTTKEELGSCRKQNEKLMAELRDRELSISKLKEEMKEVQTSLLKTADSGPPPPRPQSSASSSSITQPKRKGAKLPAIKGSTAKDKLSLSKKSPAPSSQSSNRSHSSLLSSSFEHQHVAVTDSFTQTEPLQMCDLSLESKSVAKEEMEEVISEFQEKIVQMQELHAAEILDMEARHISESENLRRDTHALEDECKALKAVIDKLQSQAPTSRQDRPIAQFRDGYTSDSSSDYSQRTGYDLPSLQQEFRTTPEGARIETDDHMPDKIKMLLREVHQEGMQVLSLSELPLSEGEPGNQFNIQGWLKERDALLATVESLKGLITQMQTHRETQTSGCVDWRAQLLDAVRQVFLRERSVLKNTLYSQLDLLDTSDAIIHLNQLERRLAEQDAHHRGAMDSLHTAERSSLISEIHQLRGQLEQIHQGIQPAVPLGAECGRKEQKEGGAAEADKLLVEELKCELSQTKLELETTLKTQHKHLKELGTLRAEVSQKASEVDALSDQLINERKKSRELQWAMEKEKCRTGRTEESKREEMEDLHLSLEEQKSRVVQLTLTLDQERQTSSHLSQQAEQERLSLHRSLQELQVQLETERAKALEMSTALGRERELRSGVSSNNSSASEMPVETDSRSLEDEGSLLARLQRELDDKHTQVVHLFSQVEAHKLEVVRKEEELMLVSQRSRRDQEALLEARTQLENLRGQMSETQGQLEREMERRRNLEEEKERLEERLARVGEQRGQGQDSGPQQADRHSSSALHSDSTYRGIDWVSQPKCGSSNASSHLEVSPAAHSSGQHHGPWRTVDKVIDKLHLVSSKIRSMSNQTPGRPTAEVDREELSSVQSSVDEVINMLQQFPGLPSVPESVTLLTGSSSSSSNSLTERLLRQNAELTGFVSRLTEEKNDLRNHVLRLEEELRRYRQAGLDSSFSQRGKSNMDSASTLLSHEREAWTREKIRLEKALHLAQSQVARLREEIRSNTLREITGPEADNAALKRMYGKYLRSESFRKALIYQKKYLLLLLGGFQECEEATLSLLCRMGGQPSHSSLESYSQRRRGLTRFRSAVRVSIALSRMRFLVKRWHKATGMSTTASSSLNKNGTGQTFSTEIRDSPYLHPGSAEMYREKGSGGGGGGGGGGVSSSRGRSGRESPRSALTSTPHRFHMAGDHSALTCSHLQSYDPDRALTDYISRLEALQRRLGSVTSGASSYAHLHFGLRR